MKKLNYQRLFELLIFPLSIIGVVFFITRLNELQDLICLGVCIEIMLLSGYDIIHTLRGVK